MNFDGKTYDPALDHDRLKKLLGRVWMLMTDGRYRTLPEIQAACGGSEASVSARLRDLRKPAFGHYVIERRRRGEAGRGLYEYAMELDQTGQPRRHGEPKGQMGLFAS